MTYVVFSSTEGTSINIYRLSDGASLDIDFSNVQSSCNFRWRSDTVLDVLEDETGQLSRGSYSINVLDKRIVSLEEQTTIIPREVNPPNLLIDDFRLISPNNSLIVYNRCNGGLFTTNLFTGDQMCTSEESIVIYDLNRQEDVEVLKDANQGQFVISADAQLAYQFRGISWSPQGRYLAYRSTSVAAPLRVYDTLHRQYINFNLPEGDDVDWFKGVIWTQDEQRLAFWVGNYEVPSKHLAIVNLDTEQIKIFSTEYQLAQANLALGWNTNSIVFIDVDSNLLEINLDSAEATLIDTNVWEILSD